MIIGGIEMVGGIITADGITREEGDFNIEVGSAASGNQQKSDGD